jgi:hypothetical protein
MCKTTTPPRPAAQNAIRNLPPNTTAGAVIPLQRYLQKFTIQFANHLVPATRPALPSDVDPDAYKRVAFALLPLRANGVSTYYAGIFDEDMDFSASLVKVAALFAAGQLLAKAKLASPGAASFFNDLKTAIQAEITANADNRVRSATYNSSIGLQPRLPTILKVTGATVDFDPTFNQNLSDMIIPSDDPAAAFCIDRLGLGYISAVLNEKNFFDKNLQPGPDKPGNTGRGIWLTGDYGGNFIVRIPCVNDHPATQLTTARQMCRMFSMIRLKQLPENDVDTNSIMQGLLSSAGTWLKMGQAISGVKNLGVAPLFSKIHAKVGVAGLGSIQRPNVYSEGLIIKWNDSSKVDAFNNKIDPGHANPIVRLSGEIAVCWQNLLAQILPSGFDGIVEVLNNTISDFLDQKAV